MKLEQDIALLTQIVRDLSERVSQLEGVPRLTKDEVQLISDTLNVYVLLLKEKNGTEFTQARLLDIVSKLELINRSI